MSTKTPSVSVVEQQEEDDEDVVVHAHQPLSLEDPTEPVPPRRVMEKESGSKRWLNDSQRALGLLLATWIVFIFLAVCVANDNLNWLYVVDLKGATLASYGWGDVTIYDTRLLLAPPLYGHGVLAAFLAWLFMALYLTVLLFRVYRHPHLDYEVQTKVRRWLRITHFISLFLVTVLVLFLLHLTIHIASMGLTASLGYATALGIASFLELQMMQFIQV